MEWLKASHLKLEYSSINNIIWKVVIIDNERATKNESVYMQIVE